MQGCLARLLTLQYIRRAQKRGVDLEAAQRCRRSRVLGAAEASRSLLLHQPLHSAVDPGPSRGDVGIHACSARQHASAGVQRKGRVRASADAPPSPVQPRCSQRRLTGSVLGAAIAPRRDADQQVLGWAGAPHQDRPARVALARVNVLLHAACAQGGGRVGGRADGVAALQPQVAPPPNATGTAWAQRPHSAGAACAARTRAEHGGPGGLIREGLCADGQRQHLNRPLCSVGLWVGGGMGGGHGSQARQGSRQCRASAGRPQRRRPPQRLPEPRAPAAVPGALSAPHRCSPTRLPSAWCRRQGAGLPGAGRGAPWLGGPAARAQSHWGSSCRCTGGTRPPTAPGQKVGRANGRQCSGTGNCRAGWGGQCGDGQRRRVRGFTHPQPRPAPTRHGVMSHVHGPRAAAPAAPAPASAARPRPGARTLPCRCSYCPPCFSYPPMRICGNTTISGLQSSVRSSIKPAGRGGQPAAAQRCRRAGHRGC